MLEPKPLEGQQASRETRGVLSVALKIEPGEGRPLAWLVAFSFFAGIVQVSFYAASSALFLSTYGSETIPWVYIASAFVATAAGAIYYRVERRWDSFRLLTGTLLFILLSIAGLRMGLASTNLPWPAFGLLTWFPVISGLMSVIQWTLAGSVFDVRQGKRLFGLVGGGGASGERRRRLDDALSGGGHRNTQSSVDIHGRCRRLFSDDVCDGAVLESGTGADTRAGNKQRR
jgi:hypothetical protein